MTLGNGAAAFFSALAITWLLVEVVRRWTLHRAILDHPNERSSHVRPTPRGGGIAFVIVVSTAMAAYAWRHGYGASAWIVIAAAIVIAAISWIDDMRGLSTALRFLIHFAAAATAIAALSWWWYLPLPFGELRLGMVLGIVVSLLWIVGLTNAYNFMDGIDGIAGGQAVVAGIGWVMLSRGVGAMAWLGLILAGAALGFLIHNWQPAKIFMGDVGSAFLGYLIAVMTLVSTSANPPMAFAFTLLVWPFLFDTIFTFLRRAWRRERVFSAHRSHLYQRLNQTGLSHAAVSTLYIALELAGLGAAWAVMRGPRALAAAATIVIVLMAVALWAGVVIRERRLRA